MEYINNLFQQRLELSRSSLAVKFYIPTTKVVSYYAGWGEMLLLLSV